MCGGIRGFRRGGSDEVVWGGLPKLNNDFAGVDVVDALPNTPFADAGGLLVEVAGENKPLLDNGC